ncbi:protein lethal(2)essential for life-like [Phymastichus coffea]|uniref:protein lethal(2)essential for life-like n=1 Tax=Phymastichus coffea TaxID=108790 RepID=UPI00273B34C5|nr:protein lethal(2)essential for life-like [Phymastichus coffea]
MSLVPLLFSDWWNDLERPHRLVDQNFGHGLTHDQLIPSHFLESYAHPSLHPLCRRNPMTYYRPWGELMRQMEGGGTSTVKADKDKFQVVLDVQQFKPEEINVKVVDKYVIVEGKHEEKQDEHGSISRHFVRKYLIPEQCNLDQVTSSLSSDGVLSITAPRKEQSKTTNEKVVKIEHTGKPAIKESVEKKVEKKDDKK